MQDYESLSMNSADEEDKEANRELEKTTKSSTSSVKTIVKVKIFVADLDQTMPTDLAVEQEVRERNGVECVDLSTFVTKVMALYELDPMFDIQVEYWSHQCQTFVACNYLNPGAA